MSDQIEASIIAERLAHSLKVISGFLGTHGPPPVRIAMAFRDSGMDCFGAADTREEASKKVVATLSEGEYVVFLAEIWLQPDPENSKRPSAMTEEERKEAGVITAVLAEVWPHNGHTPFYMVAKEAEKYQEFVLIEGRTVVYHAEPPEAKPEAANSDDPEEPDDAA